jgi:hypothetical protein
MTTGTLTDDERSLLLALGTRTLSDLLDDCSHDEAHDALVNLAAQGKLEIVGDDTQVRLYTQGNLLVEVEREWLAHYATHPELDPIKDRTWVPSRVN